MINIPTYDINEILRNYDINVELNQNLQNSDKSIEMVGESVIQGIVTEYLTNKGINNSELMKLKVRMTENQNMAKFARKLGLDKYMITNKWNDNGLSNMFCTFIGALYNQIGCVNCHKFLTKLFDETIKETNQIA